MTELNSKCSVSFRNNNSSADNNKVAQLHSDKQLMSEIEDIAIALASRANNNMAISQQLPFIKFQQELKSLFQTHRNPDSTAVKQKDDNLVDEEELAEKIKDLLYPDFCKHYPTIIELQTSRQCDNVSNKLLNLFKTYQNSTLRPVKD